MRNQLRDQGTVAPGVCESDVQEPLLGAALASMADPSLGERGGRVFPFLLTVVCQNLIRQNWNGSRRFIGQQHRESPVFGIGQTILSEAADISDEQKAEA